MTRAEAELHSIRTTIEAYQMILKNNAELTEDDKNNAELTKDDKNNAELTEDDKNNIRKKITDLGEIRDKILSEIYNYGV